MSPVSEREYMRDPEEGGHSMENAPTLAPVRFALLRRYWKIYLFVALVIVPGAFGGISYVITAMLLVIFFLLVGIVVLRFVRYLLEP